MRKILSALLALCLLALAVLALAGGGAIVEDAFKLTFVTADFKDNRAEYAGIDALSPNAGVQTAPKW